MPALVNSKVGSLRGTSGEDETTLWPRSAKNSRKPERTSERLFMGSGCKGPEKACHPGISARQNRQKTAQNPRETKGAPHSQGAPFAEESCRAANPETTFLRPYFLLGLRLAPTP